MDAACYSSLLALAANFYTGQNIDIPIKVQNSKSRLMFLLFKVYNSPGKKKKSLTQITYHSPDKEGSQVTWVVDHCDSGVNSAS